jgi:hypothetical protein
MDRFFKEKGLPPELSRNIFHIRNKMIEAIKQENEIKDYIEEIKDYGNEFQKSGLNKALNTTAVVGYDSEGNERIKYLKDINVYNDGNDGELWKDSILDMNKLNTLKHLTTKYVKEHRESLRRAELESSDDDSTSGGGAMKNQEVKKCEKKVVLGKERCIYKVSGSKKDYMKYKGKLVPVTDYIKSMKKKN